MTLGNDWFSDSVASTDAAVLYQLQPQHDFVPAEGQIFSMTKSKKLQKMLFIFFCNFLVGVRHQVLVFQYMSTGGLCGAR